MTDKLTPVRCGCGGEATVKKHTFYRALPLYSVKCDKCGIQVPSRNTEAEAIAAWNRAMGSTEKSSTVERTAKVTYRNTTMGLSFCCGNCGKPVHSEGKYCHHCGARLEWK